MSHINELMKDPNFNGNIIQVLGLRRAEEWPEDEVVEVSKQLKILGVETLMDVSTYDCNGTEKFEGLLALGSITHTEEQIKALSRIVSNYLRDLMVYMEMLRTSNRKIEELKGEIK